MRFSAPSPILSPAIQSFCEAEASDSSLDDEVSVAKSEPVRARVGCGYVLSVYEVRYKVSVMVLGYVLSVYEVRYKVSVMVLG